MLVDTLCQPAQVDGGDAHWDPFKTCGESVRGALSDKTERAVRSDLAIYAAWCTRPAGSESSTAARGASWPMAACGTRSQASRPTTPRWPSRSTEA